MVKITSLCDNINNHKKMWGIEGNSVLIETNGLRILYDVGRDGKVLAHNLEVLGLSISNIDYIILSHAHKGHSGALSSVSIPENVRVFYGPGFSLPKFKLKDGDYFPVWNEQLLNNLTVEPECIFHQVEICPDLFVFNASSEPNQSAQQRYWIKEQGLYRPDSFQEELHICIKTNKGLIIITGCAHCGVSTLIEKAISITGDNQIYTLIGGMHIKDDPMRLLHFCDIINRYQVSLYAPSHCTGFRSVAYLLKQFPNQCLEFHTGKTISFDS